MAPKEDMLPPGWEDIDRYVDILFRSIDAPKPLPTLHRHALWNPNGCPSGDLDYFHFGELDSSQCGGERKNTMLTHVAGKWASSL